MDVSSTPHDGGILTIELEGRMITFNEPSPGKVALNIIRFMQALMISLKSLGMKSKTIHFRKSTIKQ